MKIKGYKLAVISSAIILIVACGEEQPQKGKTEHSATHSSIATDAGKKWKVNPEMLVHVRNMEKSIRNMPMENADSLSTLIPILQSELNALTASCTMEGPAHDELHKWLVPLMELVERMAKEPNNTGYPEMLKASMEEFNKFFE